MGCPPYGGASLELPEHAGQTCLTRVLHENGDVGWSAGSATNAPTVLS